MENVFVPMGTYQEIVNHLGQWKVLDIKSLSKLIDRRINYFNLLKKVRRLEKQGYVKGAKIGNKYKHIYLSQKGLAHTSLDHFEEISTEHLSHDIAVGVVLRKLLDLPQFFDGRMYHQVKNGPVLPDAEIEVRKDGQKFKIAIEVELTQKSQKRVKEKYRRYALKSSFDYVLFLTDSPKLTKAYHRYLQDMEPTIREHVLLLENPSLRTHKFDIEQSQILFNEKELSFSDVFGN